MSQYHLRIITKEDIETNIVLGNQYVIIDRKKNKNEFIKIVEAYFKDGVKEDIFCFIQCSFGHVYQINKTSKIYIVTNNGSTFSNLTYKIK